MDIRLEENQRVFLCQGLEILAEYKAIYEKIGYPCYEVSALEKIGMTDDLLNIWCVRRDPIIEQTCNKFIFM